MNTRKLFGPSTLVTAAFIGPGTLKTCTSAGIQSGYDLLWALIFAGVATIVLQEMAARLGWVTQAGLGEALRSEYKGSWAKVPAFTLVISAILIGNAAYQGGNLSGAAIGAKLLIGSPTYVPLIIGSLCFLLLWFGKYKVLERLLIALVIGMSLCFLITAIIIQPSPLDIVRGLRPQAMTRDNLLLILSLIGTTVVPYNLFLHASAISQKWGPEDSLRDLRTETFVAVGLGIGISMLIVITSAAARGELPEDTTIDSPEALAIQLKPLAGNFASTLMGIGYFAAGLSSALTAPLAAAFAARGLFGWPADTANAPRDLRFVAVWSLVLFIGTAVAQSGFQPATIIMFAQVANALILPAVGIFLLKLANSRRIMGDHANGWLPNVAGVLVMVILLALCGKTFFGLLS